MPPPRVAGDAFKVHGIEKGRALDEKEMESLWRLLWGGLIGNLNEGSVGPGG